MSSDGKLKSFRFYLRDFEGSLRQISVGKNTIWGTSGTDEVYIREGISHNNLGGTLWKNIPGISLHIISVNARTNSAWGVTEEGHVFHRVGSSINNPEGTYWKNIPGMLTQISYGDSGLWGRNDINDVYYRCGTRGGHGESGVYWHIIPGKFIHVSSGEDIVLAVGTDYLLYARVGITDENPVGLKWERVSTVNFEIKYVDVTTITGDVWGLKRNGNIFHIVKKKFRAMTSSLGYTSEMTSSLGYTSENSPILPG